MASGQSLLVTKRGSLNLIIWEYSIFLRRQSCQMYCRQRSGVCWRLSSTLLCGAGTQIGGTWNVNAQHPATAGTGWPASRHALSQAQQTMQEYVRELFLSRALSLSLALARSRSRSLALALARSLSLSRSFSLVLFLSLARCLFASPPLIFVPFFLSLSLSFIFASAVKKSYHG